MDTLECLASLFQFKPSALSEFTNPNGERFIQVFGLTEDTQDIFLYEISSASEITVQKAEKSSADTDEIRTIKVPEDGGREELKKKAYDVIVKLWTINEFNPNYDKNDWKHLISILQKLDAAN